MLGWLVDGGVDVNVPIYKGKPTILAAIALSTQMALMPSSDAMLKTQPPPPNQGEETLKKILKRTKNINSTDDKGRSLLVIAIEENAPFSAIQLLIEKGARLNVTYTPSKHDECANIQGQTLLMHHHLNAAITQLMIDKGVRADAQDACGQTALMRVGDDEARANILIKNGAPINAKMPWGTTALMLAAMGDSFFILGQERGLGIVPALLVAGADVHMKDENNYTALDYALQSGQIERAQLLLAHGAVMNTSPDVQAKNLLDAASRNAVETVQFLVEQGAPINARQPKLTDEQKRLRFDAPDYGAGQTPLMHATGNYPKDIETVRYLLLKGADVNLKDDQGVSALIKSATQSYSDDKLATFQLLLSHGADVNAQDNEGRSALMAAADGWGELEAVKDLIAKGANLNLIDSEGKTALQLALENNRAAIARLLIQKGADTNIMSAEGLNTLYIATYKSSFSGCDCWDIVKTLIERGDAVDMRDKDGYSPLFFASDKPEITRLLLAKGADPKAKNLNGSTPINGASLEVLKILVEHGVDVKQLDKEGQTLLHDAVKSVDADIEMVRYLIDSGVPIESRNCIANDLPVYWIDKAEIASILQEHGVGRQCIVKGW